MMYRFIALRLIVLAGESVSYWNVFYAWIRTAGFREVRHDI